MPPPVPPPTYLGVLGSLLPPLSSAAHKGATGGKTLVVGGSPPYTGALFFSSQASVEAGADLVSSYTMSDDTAAAVRVLGQGALMVHSNNDSVAVSDPIINLLPQLSGIVLGPGLGRDRASQRFARGFASAVKEMGVSNQNTAVVVDADGLWTERFPGYSGKQGTILEELHNDLRVVLTPNVPEFRRMLQLYCPSTPNEPVEDAALKLVSTLNVGAVVVKGEVDTIIPHPSLGSPSECSCPGSKKRPGGIGDVLSGVMATFLGYRARFNPQVDVGSAIAAACAVVKESSRRAELEKGRAMTANDVLAQVNIVIADCDSA